METRKFEGEISYVGKEKEFGKLKSLGLKLLNDAAWHNIGEFSTDAVNKILGDTKPGDLVVLEEHQSKGGYWNVKKITKKNNLDDYAKPETVEGNVEQNGLEKAVGNTYAMTEKYLTAIIEQQAHMGTKLTKLMDLVIKIAEKNDVDMGFTTEE